MVATKPQRSFGATRIRVRDLGSRGIARTAIFLAILFSSRDLPAAPAGWEITTLCGKPDVVTRGYALIQVTGPGLDTPQGIRATLNGRDVPGAFRPGRSSDAMIGRVDGLRPGSNTLEVAVGGKRVAKAEL